MSTILDEQLRRLLGAPLDEQWFADLRALYARCNPQEQARVQAQLGWDDASCHAPNDADAFAADYAARNRAAVVSEDEFCDAVFRAAGGPYADDSRESLLDLAGLYHLAILRGFDPDALFVQTAERTPSPAAERIRAFLRSQDKALSYWGYGAVRGTDGRVTIQRV